MKTWILLLLVGGAMLGIYSCQCDGCTQDNWKYTTEFRGFGDSDLAPLIVKTYVKGSGFTAFRDSIVYLNLATVLEEDGNESRIIAATGDDSTDLLYVLPRLNYTYQITGMSFPTRACKACSKAYEVHTFNGYTVNGIVRNNLPDGTDIIINR